MKEVIKRIITGFFLGMISWYVFMHLHPYVFSCILGLTLVHILLFEWPNFFSPKSSIFWLLMPVYPILPFFLMISMNHHADYRNLLFMIIVIVSTFDTGAYVIGSMIGRHKIAPSISPGKTWEGFFGGYICAGIGFAYLLGMSKGVDYWLIIALFTMVICILDSLGDFFESWLKRRARIKDSGTALPGHGGFLDRFDGILFAITFFYLYKDYLIRLFLR